MLSVIEQFISLDGEGPTEGELAYFVRFSGCNLRCSWCDTAYSWDGTTQIQEKTAQQIYEEIKACSIRNVTLTGGEPLLQIDFLIELFRKAKKNGVHTTLDTSGNPFTREEQIGRAHV